MANPDIKRKTVKGKINQYLKPFGCSVRNFRRLHAGAYLMIIGPNENSPGLPWTKKQEAALDKAIAKFLKRKQPTP